MSKSDRGEEMPEFGNPFSVLKHDRLLTQLYEQLADSTDEALAQNVLREIACEEKVHVGEFLRLLKELQPNEEGFYQQGAQEVEVKFLNKK
jgi:rubrerythrin